MVQMQKFIGSLKASYGLQAILKIHLEHWVYFKIVDND